MCSSMETAKTESVGRFLLLWIMFSFDFTLVNSNLPGSPSFRLVGGTSRYNGRVEVYYNGQWGTVCDDSFGTNEARVLCKTLGMPFNHSMAVSSRTYGKGSGNIWLDDIICHGYESSILQCRSNDVGEHNCHHYEDLGVVCTNDAHAYRIAQGNQVQVLAGGKWLAIQSENFHRKAAIVFCKSLNLPFHDVQVGSHDEDAAFWLENNHCGGNETSLYDCRQGNGTNHRDHSQPAATVNCTGDCGDLSSPTYGTVHFNATTFHSIGNYSCSPGYILQGSSTRTCLGSGNWSGIIPICEPKDCGNLTAPGHGEVDFISTVFQSEATYLCDIGYVLQGSNRTQCLSTGQWDTVAPICEPIDCGLPDQPKDGRVIANNTVYRSVAVYDCIDGFLLQGSKLSVCLLHGNWSKQPPLCEPIDDVKKSFCDRSTDERGGKWGAALGGTLVAIPCSSVSQDLMGNVTRYCTDTGTWLMPQYDCVRAELQQLEEAVLAIRQNVSAPAIDTALSTLSSVTRDSDQPGGLYEGEITKATDMLDTIADISSDIVISEEQSQSFIETVGNLIDTKNKAVWQSLSETSDKQSQDTKKEPKSAKILSAVGKYANAIAKTLDGTNQTQRIVPSDNMDMLVAKVENARDIEFPGKAFIKLATSTKTPSFRLDKISVIGATSYSGVVFKNMVGILPPTPITDNNSTEKRDQQINSAVMAVQLNSNLTEHLPSPIVLTFRHLQEGYTDANCMFWNEQRHGWDSNGCRTIRSNSTTTVCECDHLTNFAILMSPWRKENVSTKTIDILSYVGCSISVLCLIVTVAMHLRYWRYLRPHFRTVILMHLCVALAFSYVLFLFGADKTDHKDVCTSMASLLHYMYLAVFFIMLAECIDVAWIVLMPLKQSSHSKWTLAAAWVLPAVIVGVSLGVTKLRGYGTESYCWLSNEAGLIWAFVGPALIVIVINFIVMVLVVRTLCHTKSMQEKKALDRIKSSLWCLLVLLPLTGCSWIIGIFYVNEDTEWIQYVFVVCNALQGFVIFVCHCVLNKQMLEAIKQSRRKRSTSMLHSGTSSSKTTGLHMPFVVKSKTYTVSFDSSSGTRM